MTYEKAVQALVDSGLLAASDMEAAVTALDQPNVEFTYPDWAAALAKAGLIAAKFTGKAEAVMEAAAETEAESDPEDFDEGLASAGVM